MCGPGGALGQSAFQVVDEEHGTVSLVLVRLLAHVLFCLSTGQSCKQPD